MTAPSPSSPSSSSSNVVPLELAPFAALPQQAVAQEALLSSMRKMAQGDADWRNGRCFSLVYHASDEHAAFLKQAHNLFFEENGLNPMAFKSLKRMEQEVVRMACTLFSGDAQTCGTMTSGGTESLLLVVKTARDMARATRRGIKKPELVMPATAHVAFDKAAHYFGVKIRRARVGADFRVDVRQVERLINKNTVLIVGSAPQYPHGVIDPIEELGRIALKHDVPLHVDACVGGFILPFLEKNGRAMPRWDFRVPGVTSISADLHKYGYAAKGASVLVYRSLDMLKHQFFVATEFPGGIYASPTIPGTRPGGTIAAAWAGLLALGEDGYKELAASAASSADRIRDGLSRMGLELLGAPHATIVAWRVPGKKGGATYAVADLLEDKGWHIDRQQNPECIHLTVTANHAAAVDDYLRDVEETVAFVRAHPDVQSKGNAAMYGMMAKVPARFLVKDAVQKIMEGMYGPAGKPPEVEKPDGVVGVILEKYGDRAMAVLDAVDHARDRFHDVMARVRR